MPSDLHETALVTATGGLTTSSLCDSCVMYLDAEIRQRFQDTQYSNSLLKNLAFGRLWVPKVHHLVQQLVDDNEVVPD
jgi:hypothetical protein